MAAPLQVPQFVDAPSSHPAGIRWLNRAGRLLPRPAPLRADVLWAEARRGALADVEPAPEAREALEVLLDSLAANVRWSLVGRFSAKDDTLRLLRTHLRVQRALREAPAIDETPLPPPVFIIGWPRTGTTFLHQLLARDPSWRTIPYWESFDPVPPAPGEPDRRIERLDEMLRMLRRIAPRYDAIHPMTSESVEECVALFMNDLRTLQLDFQYRVPEYARWLLEQDARVAYRGYRRQLRLIQHHRPEGARFLLKDPTHLVHLETLIELFPDAKFVFTHRDPAVALSSICSLVAYTRALFTDDVDPRAIGQEIAGGYWPEALERGRVLRASLGPERAVDVRHPDLLRDPLGSVEALYRGLGLPLDAGAREAMATFLAERRAGPTSRHEHALEGFGLSREAVRERFKAYCEAFDL